MTGSSDLQGLVNQALSFHRAGQAVQALDLYHRILSQVPDHVDALNLGGILLHSLGDAEGGRAMVWRAVSLAPDHPGALANLAFVHQAEGDLPQALACLRQALVHAPDEPDILANAAYLSFCTGDMDAALDYASSVLASVPDHPSAGNTIGLVLLEQGDATAALRHFDRVLLRAPSMVGVHANRARALLGLGRDDDAVAAFRSAVARDRSNPELWRALGDAQVSLGALQEAETAYRRSLTLDPSHIPALKNLGSLLEQAGRAPEAAGIARQGLLIEPEDAEFHNNLGVALIAAGDLRGGIEALQAGLRCDPDHPVLARHLAVRLLSDLGDVDSALPLLRAAAAADLGGGGHSALLMAMQYSATVLPCDISAGHRSFAQTCPVIAGPAPAPFSSVPADPLRIGFFSADFRNHATGVFLPPVLDGRCHHRWEAYLYSVTPHPDSLTTWFSQNCDSWCDASSMDGGSLVDRIRDDALDILFDLSGHTRYGIPALFSQRMAGRQGGWIGLDYVWENGMPHNDFILADPSHIPLEMDALFSSSVIRMNRAYCFRFPEDAPEAAAPPCLDRGFVTFGCQNALFKMGSGVVALWAEILHAVPESRLMLGAPSLDYAVVRDRVFDLFCGHGIDAGRLLLYGSTDRRGVLERYNQIDIALDPFPYGGGLTTLEALWMGVPVVCMPGDRPASNHSPSHLRACGMEDWIARDHRDYIRLAVELAGNRAELVQRRSLQRQRMSISPLCDETEFGLQFRQALDTILALQPSVYRVQM